ncbi:MAG: zinc ribbon domain-containing protein [Methanobacteriota archaeon]|nr:MAG: zinc ribbon domain-containing protein [Euryarchaeota archaeon]
MVRRRGRPFSSGAHGRFLSCNSPPATGGEKLAAEVRCPRCGAANRPETAFCVNCGSPLAAGGTGTGAMPSYPAPAYGQGFSSPYDQERQKQIDRTKTGVFLLLIWDPHRRCRDHRLFRIGSRSLRPSPRPRSAPGGHGQLPHRPGDRQHRGRTRERFLHVRLAEPDGQDSAAPGVRRDGRDFHRHLRRGQWSDFRVHRDGLSERGLLRSKLGKQRGGILPESGHDPGLPWGDPLPPLCGSVLPRLEPRQEGRDPRTDDDARHGCAARAADSAAVRDNLAAGPACRCSLFLRNHMGHEEVSAVVV